jgi:Sugar (and other) transporter.
MAFGLSFPFLVIGTLFVGLATGADLPVSLATISEAADDNNRGKIIGLSNLLWLVGIGATMGISAIVGDWGKVGAQIMYLHVGLVALVLLVLRWSIPESPLWLVARDELRRGVATVRAQKNGWRDLLDKNTSGRFCPCARSTPLPTWRRIPAGSLGPMLP